MRDKEWHPILPDKYIDMCNLLNSISRDSKVLIVDDIDCDGQMSAYVVQEILLHRFPKIEIFINDKHGFKENLENFSDYGLIIIVDSSSELIEQLESDIPTLIIDHHEYNRNLVSPSNVLLMNSKDTKGLECISAGMFTYILLSEYIKGIGVNPDPKLFSLGAITLYSDVVPVDKYVKLCLNRLIDDIKSDNIHPMLNYLNTYCNPINKGTLSYNIVPSNNLRIFSYL